MKEQDEPLSLLDRCEIIKALAFRDEWGEIAMQLVKHDKRMLAKFERARSRALEDARQTWLRAESYHQSPEIVTAIRALRDKSPQAEARIVRQRESVREGRELNERLLGKDWEEL
jgi:hypothetical protein